MEDEEGPECGKADFVLLDQVTMEDFMENLKLRWAGRSPLPDGEAMGGRGTHSTRGPFWARVTEGDVAAGSHSPGPCLPHSP